MRTGCQEGTWRRLSKVGPWLALGALGCALQRHEKNGREPEERSASPNYLFLSKQRITGRRTKSKRATKRVILQLK